MSFCARFCPQLCRFNQTFCQYLESGSTSPVWTHINQVHYMSDIYKLKQPWIQPCQDMTAKESRQVGPLAEKYPLKVKLESNGWQREFSQVTTLGVQNTTLLQFNSTVPYFSQCGFLIQLSLFGTASLKYKLIFRNGLSEIQWLQKAIRMFVLMLVTGCKIGSKLMFNDRNWLNKLAN